MKRSRCKGQSVGNGEIEEAEDSIYWGQLINLKNKNEKVPRYRIPAER